MRRARWAAAAADAAADDDDDGGGEDEEGDGDGAEGEAEGGLTEEADGAPTAGKRLPPRAPFPPFEAAPGRAATLSRHCIAICFGAREGRERRTRYGRKVRGSTRFFRSTLEEVGKKKKKLPALDSF